MMSQKTQQEKLLKAIEDELAIYENSEAMDKADGKGVQKREVGQDAAPSKSEKKKGFKLTGGGQSVGGDAGGVTESSTIDENEAVMDTADGTGVANKTPKDINGTDANGAPGFKANGSDGKEKEKMGDGGGAGVQSKSVGKSSADGSKDGKAVEKARGSSVASTSEKEDGSKNDGVKENVVTLPHDVVVEEDGEKKTIKAGTKVVLGEMFDEPMGGAEDEMDMINVEPEPMGDEGCPMDGDSIDMTGTGEPLGGGGADQAMITAIVTAVVAALNGGGEYDYAMEGKEVSVDALSEDVGKILGESGKPWLKGKEDDDESSDDGDKKDDDKDDGEMEECAESRKTRTFGSLTESRVNRSRTLKEELDDINMDDGEDELDSLDNEDELDLNGEDDFGDEEDVMGKPDMSGEIDKQSPDYIAALVDDIAADFDQLKDVLGSGGDEEDFADEEGEEEYADEEEYAKEEGEEEYAKEEGEDFADEDDETEGIF